MTKIVIVDDEMLVRLGIKSFINSMNGEFEILGTFQNGKEALEFCSSNKPDIVLTDLLMPVMDGLELIRKLKELYHDIKIVVLSCYDDYNLVKSAFKLGVKDYVLKHEVQMEELFKILTGIKSELSEIASEPMKISAADEKNLLFNTLINWREGQPYPDGISNIINKSELRMSQTSIIVTCFKMDDEYDENFVKTQDRIEPYAVINTIEEVFNRYNTGELFLDNQGMIIGVLCFDKDNSDRIVREKLSSMLYEIKERMGKFFNRSITIGVSCKYISFRDIRTAYGEALAALSHRYYLQRGHTIFFNEVVINKNDISKQDINSIKDLIIDKSQYSFNANGVIGFIDKYLNRQTIEKSLTPNEIKKDINTFVYIIDDFVWSYLKIKVDQVFGNDFVAYKQIDQLDNIYVLGEWMQYYILKIDKYLKYNGTKSSQIERMKEYIEGHYAENINLKSISQAFYLNSNYFCQYFKRESGKNFTDYLSETRINKAKVLLKTSEMSTPDIAQKVGIENANYFVKVFKKVTGLSVSEFKKVSNN